MANQEGVKIVITAEDRFTDNIKKIDAYTKLFGETAKNTERHLAALEKEMVRLVANGMDPASAKIKQMKANYDSLQKSLDSGTSSIKKSNQQWTNLALVVQDLPYGFRGIQNNLPALVGGFASLTGPIYLVSSAIIALFTAWDAGLFKTKNSISILEAANKEYADSFKQSAGAAGEEIAKINSLVALSSNHEAAMSKRLAAVKKLQAEYPNYFGNLSQEKILNGDVKSSVDSVKSAILERAKATAVASKINKLAAEKFTQEERLYQLALQKTFKIQKAVSYVNQMKALGYDESSKHLKGLIDTQVNGIREEENTIKGTVDTIDKELTRLQGIYDKTTPTTIGLDDTSSKGGKKPKPKKQKQDIFDILKTTKEFYDAKLNFAEGDESAQRDILLREKQTLDELIDGNQISWNDYYSSVSSIYKKLVDFQIKEDKRLLDSQKDADKESVKNVNAQLDATLKATRGNYQAQKAAIQAAIDKNKEFRQSAIDAGKGTEIFDSAIVNLENKLSGLVDPLEELEINFNTVINSIATGALVELGTQIGNVFAGAGFSIDGFLGLIADALIKLGTYLVTVSKLFLAIKALFASGGALAGWAIPIGLAAIAAGVALKASLNKESVPKFANGGIVSGPTLGLMGEYPGARSNPEVIAPLDKLKGLVGGGGGGTLSARISGNDLLILMNKAQRTNSTTF
jgi:hypothetical protein